VVIFLPKLGFGNCKKVVRELFLGEKFENCNIINSTAILKLNNSFFLIFATSNSFPDNRHARITRPTNTKMPKLAACIYSTLPGAKQGEIIENALKLIAFWIFCDILCLKMFVF